MSCQRPLNRSRPLSRPRRTAHITADKPILVAHYAHGNSYDLVPNDATVSGYGDPTMMLVVPHEQFLNSYTLRTTPPPPGIPARSAFNENWVNILAPSAAVGSITVDGQAIPASAFVAVGTSGFSGAQVRLETPATAAATTHSLAGPVPFGASLYGFGEQKAYGYPGGMSLVRVTSVALAPKTATKVAGTQDCVTASVQDQDSAPIAGRQVDFKVTGANSTVGFAPTGANGEAPFCYTGANAGTDTIEASVGAISDTAAKTWTAANAPPTGISLSNASVAENSPLTTTVGTLSTTDPDSGNTFAYELASGEGSADNGAFTIVGNELKTATALDYETKNSYGIRVRTADQGGLIFERALTIAVTDINENVAPTANAGSDAAGDEGAAILLTGAGSDLDGDALTYVWSYTAVSGVDSGATCTFSPRTQPTRP